MPTQAFIVATVLLSMVSLYLINMVLSLKKNNDELAKELLKLRENTNEPYIKFVTDSRDWAYQYIEQVQSGLKKYIDVVEPQLIYYNTYGRSIEGLHNMLVDNTYPAFKDLKSLLPEDNKEK